MMDEAVRVPGTPLRIGLDGLLGLIPGVGDLAGGLLSSWFIVAAARLGAPPSVLARMGLNIGLDAVTGAVPLAGDLFDFAWKANRRNLALLERHLAEPDRVRRSSRAVIAAALGGVLAATLLVLAGAIAIAAALVRWLFQIL
jgi:hypothetical protein